MATLSTGGNVLDFTLCQSSDCESIYFSELTGVYTASNSGGWAVLAGAGALVNFVPSDAIDAHVTVTLPDGTIATAVNLYSTFPDSAGTATQTITNTNLGITGALPDGIYTATYQVDVSNVSSQTVSFTITKSFFLSCTIKCCVDKLIAKIAVADCSCEDPALKNALLAWGLYESLLKAGQCGNTTKVANLLARITKLCSITNCGCS